MNQFKNSEEPGEPHRLRNLGPAIMKAKFSPSARNRISILVVGYVGGLSPQALAKSGFRTRHVYLIGDYTREYAVVDHFCEGWRVTHTFFAEEAFCGHWNQLIAEASPTDPYRMGQSAREVLRDAAQLIDTEEMRLISPS